MEEPGDIFFGLYNYYCAACLGQAYLKMTDEDRTLQVSALYSDQSITAKISIWLEGAEQIISHPMHDIQLHGIL